MLNRKFFSIIIPIYNSEEFILDTLNSISKQDYDNFEVLMVNDGSTDNTKEILNNYSEKDNRFRLLSQSNSGPNVARNLALQNACGDYLLFLDSDDIFKSHTLSRLHGILKTNSYDFINFGYEFKNFETNKIIHNANYTTHDLLNGEILQSSLVSGGISGVCWSKCIKRNLILDNKIEFTPDRFHGRDILFSRTVSFYAKKALVLADNLVVSRYRAGSYSRNFGEKNIISALNLIEKHNSFFDGKLSSEQHSLLNEAFIRHLRYIFILNSFRASSYAQFKSNVKILNTSGLRYSSTRGASSAKLAVASFVCKFPNVFWLLSKVAKSFGFQPY
ncbi:glycosyltransferase family 2 protein [Pseudoalteromonas phenolica]|uniref:Glycosyl transferase n=1 Tax=Pseudoalteromonas phenolica TaxID=161398 RepID=A0A0S2JY43_9GAMM|nr:glycosyltransferase [Pseudoalteromonas phenolica]ALO40953.1 Glycosyl transferase [Pseudoalteromonas phenolica]MBE0354525.1 alpha-1,6-rhamnosyltransferase [Pseudoalteromonas phenolica O-BC30]RXF05542.1 glycosyltransferase [Pseudoalteromonas phenolica O-BC30]